ncbi:hypothetical protein ACTFIT_006324 [Dictyostelium discoideum]
MIFRSVPTITINNKKFKFLKDGQFDFIDISYKCGIDKKTKYIRNIVSLSTKVANWSISMNFMKTLELYHHNVPGIRLVLFVIVGARDPINGSWNGFAFNRSVSIQYPTAAISFGTRASTIRNENKVLNLTGNQSQLSGSTSTNNKQQANLIPNNPPFFITIPSAILLSGVEPIKIDPQPQNFVFDLFLLKNRIDILPNFFQSGHNIYIEPN